MARGDREALGQLYDRYASLLLATGRRILGSRREAEDLVHDVMMEAWKKSELYSPDRGTVRTWLLVRLRSRALDRCRRQRRFGTEPLTDEPGDEHASPQSDPDRGTERRRAVEAVRALPPRQREVLELAYFAGLSSSEIADTLKIPIGTVKSRTAAGLGKLRASLTTPAHGHAVAGVQKRSEA